jgi:hypothetical protein
MGFRDLRRVPFAFSWLTGNAVSPADETRGRTDAVSLARGLDTHIYHSCKPTRVHRVTIVASQSQTWDDCDAKEDRAATLLAAALTFAPIIVQATEMTAKPMHHHIMHTRTMKNQMMMHHRHMMHHDDKMKAHVIATLLL